MSKKSEPAFPAYQSDHRGAACNTTFTPQGGMSLRDYFAAKAMQADITANTQNRTEPKEAAEYAYRVADAMLDARKEC